MFESVRNLVVRFAPVVILGWVPAASGDIIDGEEFIDPTRPLEVVSAVPESSEGESRIATFLDRFRGDTPPTFDVTFVRASSNSPMAIVNEQRVTLGDVVNGATVVGIDRNGVTLAVDGLERHFGMFSNSVKSPVRQ